MQIMKKYLLWNYNNLHKYADTLFTPELKCQFANIFRLSARGGIIHWLLRSTVYGFIKDRVIVNKFWNCILEQKSRISTALLLFALKVRWKNWFTQFTFAEVRKVYTQNISKKLCFVRFTLCVSCNHAYSLTCLFY